MGLIKDINEKYILDLLLTRINMISEAEVEVIRQREIIKKQRQQIELLMYFRDNGLTGLNI